MIRKLIATTALTGALALGVTGVAGAASGGATTTTATPKACARAPHALARLDKLNAKYQAWLPKAEARETAAKKTHHTKLAAAIAKRITRAQKAYAKGAALYQKIEAKCPGATAAAGTTSGGGTASGSGSAG